MQKRSKKVGGGQFWHRGGRPLATRKGDNRWAPSLWNHDTLQESCWLCWRMIELPAERKKGNYNHWNLKGETQTKAAGTQTKPTHSADSQLSPCETRNKKIWALRTHLFSRSYCSLVSSKTPKHISTEKSHELRVFNAKITCSVWTHLSLAQS